MNLIILFFGFLSGIVGGMGMGGGTLLIPLLRLVGAEQHTAQAANLISFLPMCAIALSYHRKNGLVKASGTGWLTLFAVIGSIVGSIFAGITKPTVLRSCFGVLMLLFGAYQLIKAISGFKSKSLGSKV